MPHDLVVLSSYSELIRFNSARRLKEFESENFLIVVFNNHDLARYLESIGVKFLFVGPERLGSSFFYKVMPLVCLLFWQIFAQLQFFLLLRNSIKTVSVFAFVMNAPVSRLLYLARRKNIFCTLYRSNALVPSSVEHGFINWLYDAYYRMLFSGAVFRGTIGHKNVPVIRDEYFDRIFECTQSEFGDGADTIEGGADCVFVGQPLYKNKRLSLSEYGEFLSQVSKICADKNKRIVFKPHPNEDLGIYVRHGEVFPSYVPIQLMKLSSRTQLITVSSSGASSFSGNVICVGRLVDWRNPVDGAQIVESFLQSRPAGANTSCPATWSEFGELVDNSDH